MNKRLRSVTLISGLILLASVFIITGCSNNSPLEPNQPQSLTLDRHFAASESSELTIVSASLLVNKDAGGVIEIERDAYVHLFTVESAALDANTEISVVSSNEKVLGKNMIVFEFGPDGLVFGKSAILDFEIAELNSRALSAKLYYYDPDLKSWVFQGSSAISGGVASFNIDHFSKYAISD